jgi:hypothetical protein
MPLTKSDAPGAAKEEPAKAKSKAPAHPGDLTPSGYALDVVGEFTGDPGSPAALKHGERYQAEKRKRRFGL